jgi:hypothetical protein
MLPVDEVRIDPVTVNNIGLGRAFTQRSNSRNLPGFKTVKGPGRHTWQRQRK